jgi:hypothetical protein
MNITKAVKSIDRETFEPKIIFEGEYTLESAAKIDPQIDDTTFLIMLGKNLIDGIRDKLEENKDIKNDKDI